PRRPSPRFCRRLRSPGQPALGWQTSPAAARQVGPACTRAGSAGLIFPRLRNRISFACEHSSASRDPAQIQILKYLTGTVLRISKTVLVVFTFKCDYWGLRFALFSALC